ncbi:MAG TPA: amidophosphoribosyltransferase [Flavobacteriales bacterium]|nr:amidophosphoribosyltransferase [Flavobacteriales bacterium]
MSDNIKHECGIAVLRLLQPLEYYVDKYGTAFYGLNKMYLLMEKQHNRGQDGAGLANIKFDMQPGQRYISRKRSINTNAIQEIFSDVYGKINNGTAKDPSLLKDIPYLKENFPFMGELFLGHLRYGTYGKNSIESCHPFLRQNNWTTRNLVVAGNFNLTNVDELFDHLTELGQHPKEMSDTVTVMEKIGHFLDVENERLFKIYKALGYNNRQISGMIAANMDIQSILAQSAEKWDGGYAMAGLIGHGDAFVLRDPNGIRPAFYYHDNEICVVASERPVIQTAFNLPVDAIQEITPGHALVIRKNGQIGEFKITEPGEKRSCSFERIYFSRGSDQDIYRERIQLGRNVVPQILETIQYDLDNTVFSYIPNTAETAFYGMIKGVEDYLNGKKKELILALGQNPDEKKLEEILAMRPRVEKLAVKDAKLRTFITNDDARDDMVAHVYDITHGTVKKNIDNLVVIDDSIVRGTTLRKSIIKMLDRLSPKRVIIVSSAPQIRFPDCYGIDMAIMGDFIAFQAAVELLRERNQSGLLDEVYLMAKEQLRMPREQARNVVQKVYDAVSMEDISDKVGQLVTPPDCKAEVKVIFQTIDSLHKACPNHSGDWYFSGNYPTPGGRRVANRAFVNFMEGKKVRAY